MQFAVCFHSAFLVTSYVQQFILKASQNSQCRSQMHIFFSRVGKWVPGRARPPTAVFCVATPKANGEFLVQVANVGDSRIIVCRGQASPGPVLPHRPYPLVSFP